MRALAAGMLCAIALVVAAGAGAAPAAPAARGCPAAWRAGWQALANRIGAAVYCPTWMPSPLDGKIGGDWEDIHSVDRDRSYLISFLSHDQSGDVHVNFRGYPGRTAIPTCKTITVDGKDIRRGRIACFADPQGTTRASGITATLYAVNQDADQWHILYAWRRSGSLYAVSEHVIRPLTYRQVRSNLDRILKGLVLVAPSR